MLEYPQIDPAILKIPEFSLLGATFNLQLRWYSMMYIIGLAAVYLFFRWSSQRNRLKLTLEQIETVMIYGLIGMILGARVVYVFVYNFDHYIAHPNEILAVWKGGLSFHGALIGVISGLFVFARRNGMSFFNLTDHAAVATPVGLGFGRIGNFINNELWGRVTDVPWGMVFPGAGSLPRHPSQLYESMLEGWLLLAVMIMLYRKKPKTGVISGVFLLGYGTARFFLEFFREPDAQLGTIVGPFSMGQILCALMWIAGGIIIVWALNSRPAPRMDENLATP